MILVSACLCGIDCKYNGENNLVKPVLDLLREGKAIPVCPEQLGGLPTPRTACEICSGTGKDVLKGETKVVSKDGTDCTKYFIKGAEETLKIAKALNIEKAILKENSPSCGSNFIYDGSFSGNKTAGRGVTAELLFKNGIEILNENLK